MNVTRWEAFKRIPQQATYRNWSAFVGVLMWSWHLAGTDKGTVAPIIELSQILGGVSDFEEMLSVEDSVRQALQPFVDELFENKAKVRERLPLPSVATFLASDACKTAGAGVRWHHRKCEVIQTHAWDDVERKEHINMRETPAAIATVLQDIQTGSPDRLLLLGTDNTTARAALRHGMFPGQRELTEELRDMNRQVKAMGCQTRVIHVAGKIMAADAPSRGGALVKEHCQATYKVLTEYWRMMKLEEACEARTSKRSRHDLEVEH